MAQLPGSRSVRQLGCLVKLGLSIFALYDDSLKDFVYDATPDLLARDGIPACRYFCNPDLVSKVERLYGDNLECYRAVRGDSTLFKRHVSAHKPDEDTKLLLRQDDVAAVSGEKIRCTSSADLEHYQEKVMRAGARSGRLLASFQKRQKEARHTFVYRLGARGFYAELTTVARAILFCLAFDLRLVIDSRAFAYRCEHGWNDYFLPFCPDLIDAPDTKVDLDCHSDIRGPGTVFDSLLAYHPESIEIGDTTIRGFQQILGTLLLMIFRLNDQTSREVAQIELECALPPRYASIHIRRGDKVGDEDHHYPVALYLDRLEAMGAADLPLFVLSDDHACILDIRAELRRRQSSAVVHSLTDDRDQGFSIATLRRRHSAAPPDGSATDAGSGGFREQIGLDTIRLLAETVIASRSECFIGTFQSNVSRSIWFLHDQPGRCVLLTPDALQNAASERA